MTSSTLATAADADIFERSSLTATLTELSAAPFGGFRFLELPRELRDMIYQHLLAADYVSRQVTKPKFEPSNEESSIRGVYESFEHENQWISVCVNWAGYGKNLKKRGYAVKTCEAPDAIKRCAVLQISAIFPNNTTSRNHSEFLMATVGGNQLPRALWTTTGMRDMAITLTIHPSLAGRPTHQNQILAPYYQLRGVRDVIIEGSSQTTEDMKDCMKSPYTYEEADQRLMTGFALRHANIDGATHVRCLESLLAFWSDYVKICRHTRSADSYWSACDFTSAIVGWLITAKSKVHQYESIINYANYAIRILERKTALFAIVSRTWIDAYRTKTIASQNEERVVILRSRAQAYACLDLEQKAMQDLSEAKSLAPSSLAVNDDIFRVKHKIALVPVWDLPSFNAWRASRERKQ